MSADERMHGVLMALQTTIAPKQATLLREATVSRWMKSFSPYREAFPDPSDFLNGLAIVPGNQIGNARYSIRGHQDNGVVSLDQVIEIRRILTVRIMYVAPEGDPALVRIEPLNSDTVVMDCYGDDWYMGPEQLVKKMLPVLL